MTQIESKSFIKMDFGDEEVLINNSNPTITKIKIEFCEIIKIFVFKNFKI